MNIDIELTSGRGEERRSGTVKINGEDISQYVTALLVDADAADFTRVRLTMIPDVVHVTIEGDEPPDIYFAGDGMAGYMESDRD